MVGLISKSSFPVTNINDAMVFIHTGNCVSKPLNNLLNRFKEGELITLTIKVNFRKLSRFSGHCLVSVSFSVSHQASQRSMKHSSTIAILSKEKSIDVQV